MGKHEMNIFRVVEMVDENWKRKSCDKGDLAFLSDEMGGDVRELFAAEFHSFVYGCSWAVNETQRKIVGLISAGADMKTAMRCVGMKPSAFHMRILRITRRINEILFSGASCPEGIRSLTDAAGLNYVLGVLRYQVADVNMFEEFSPRQLAWLQDRALTDDGGSMHEVDKRAYCSCLAYLLTVSRSYELAMLDHLDGAALNAVLSELKGDGVTKAKYLFGRVSAGFTKSVPNFQGIMKLLESYSYDFDSAER